MDVATPDTSAQSLPPPRLPVADTWHTLLLLGIMAVWATLSYVGADVMRGSAPPSRVPMYLKTMAMEWLVTGYIFWGVRRRGGTLRELIGGRWGGPLGFFLEVGIAAGFWLGAIFVLATVALAIGAPRRLEAVSFMLPRGEGEMALWVLMAMTAGFCEEVIFRGYLQRQFTAWTRSAAAGIGLSAIAFGLGHVYQSGKSGVVIFVYGLMFGVLAHYRRSLRPGMMAHAWQDTVAGLLGNWLLRR